MELQHLQKTFVDQEQLKVHYPQYQIIHHAFGQMLYRSVKLKLLSTPDLSVKNARNFSLGTFESSQHVSSLALPDITHITSFLIDIVLWNYISYI